MGLMKRKGFYYLQFKEQGKYKRISLRTKNKELAQKLFDRYLLARITDKITTVQSGSVLKENNQKMLRPVRQGKLAAAAFEEYMELCESQNLSLGIMQSKERLKKLLKDKGIKYLDRISQKFINDIAKNSKKDTANRYIKNLKAFLNFCIKKRYYDRSDYESLLFLLQDDNVRDTVINQRDYKKLIKNCKDSDFRLYLMSLWETGCRPNEIINLKKADIDFAKGTAKIFQSKTKKYKTIYLTDELLEIYSQVGRENIFDGCGKQKEFYAKKFRYLRESLNLDKKYCLYTFRHTFGTKMLDKTKDLHLVSKLLGHSDISVTAKHYINRSDDEIRRKLHGRKS